jgi:hypothetical protein
MIAVKATIPNMRINGARQQPKQPSVGPNVKPNKVKPVALAVVLGPISVSFILIVYNNMVKLTKNNLKGNPLLATIRRGLIHLGNTTKTK